MKSREEQEATLLSAVEGNSRYVTEIKWLHKGNGEDYESQIAVPTWPNADIIFVALASQVFLDIAYLTVPILFMHYNVISYGLK